MDVIAVDSSAKSAANDAQNLVDAVRENMHEFLLYGIPKAELEGIMARVFQEADKDNSGTLDKNVRTSISLAIQNRASVTTSSCLLAIVKAGPC